MKERLQKIMARAGYGSRRSCEKIIEAGRVEVNGKRATLGTSADPGVDVIKVDGDRISAKMPPRVYIALHKPRGVLSDVESKDPRPNVKGLVPETGHLYAVGRLDMDSEGLILLTNDGELTNRLTHPRFGHEKEYHVLVSSLPDREQIMTWRRGVVLNDGYKTKPANVRFMRKAGQGAWLAVILREGRKRQIREVGAKVGLPVKRIIRVRLATLELGDLKLGEYRYLSPEEVEDLRNFSTRQQSKRRRK